MDLTFRLCLICSTLLVCNCLKLSLVEKTYNKGIKAYAGERWSECISMFEESLHLYKLYKGMILNCRLKCNTRNYIPNIKENIEDLIIYEKFFNKRNCLTECREQSFEDAQLLKHLEEYILHNMKARKPYEYLHMCYFQMNALPKAASATYTYLVAHPNDETMKHNLKYYINQPEVDVNEVVDLLIEDYMTHYNLGRKAYNKKNWVDTITHMEEVLRDYFSSENSCRMECEHQSEQEQSLEFLITISNNMASLLHCYQLCQEKLKIMNYNSGVEFVADILNYLQISFYKLNKYEEAAKTLSSYLVLLPNDEDMLANKKIYSKLVDETAFINRSDIVYYYKRDNYEKMLLQMFHGENKNSIDSNSI